MIHTSIFIYTDCPEIDVPRVNWFLQSTIWDSVSRINMVPVWRVSNDGPFTDSYQLHDYVRTRSMCYPMKRPVETEVLKVCQNDFEGIWRIDFFC